MLNSKGRIHFIRREEALYYLFRCKYRRKLINCYNYIIFTICFSCYFIWDICSSQEIINSRNISNITSVSTSVSGGSNSCEVNSQPALSICSNHGECINNTCHCHHGWTGSNCQFCNGKIRLNAESGWISDGSGNYTSNMKCTWLLQSFNEKPESGLSRPAPIILRLEEFATECGWDHVYIFDGDSVHAPLLSVFSGLLVQKNYKVLQLPEIVAKSGYALIHFYTDVAYNLTGFNITYRTNSCPSLDSNVVCSGNGVCVNEKCTCNGKWMGDACQIEKCPNNCTHPHGICDMESHKCQCFIDFKGHDCNQRTDSETGYWEVLNPKFAPPRGSASHSSIVYNNSLWIIGGTSLNHETHKAQFYRYDMKENLWEQIHVKGVALPNIYGHSSVLYENKMYVYGGVHEGKFGTSYVSGEIWAFDFNSRAWSKISVHNGECRRSMCGPLDLTGHSAIVVNDKGQKSRHSKMVVIFGHSPHYGYVNAVQEFHFGSQVWNVVKTKGFPVTGTHGHSSSWDPVTHKIYVFGGYRSTSETALSSTLYSFEPASRTWYLLESSPEGRFLHSGLVYMSHLYIFGGNSHNDTAYSVGTKCFTSEVLVYDIECDKWSNIEPPEIPTDLSRYGHSSVLYNDAIYIYGGFNGVMLSDIVKFTPAKCDALSSSTCLERSEFGMRCEWNDTTSKCVNSSSFGSSAERETCLQSSSKQGASICETLKNCASCVQNNLGCVWCGGQCHHSKCKDLRHKAVVSLEQCNGEEAICGPFLNNCLLCSAETNCIWTKEARCSKDMSLLRNDSEVHIEPEPIICERSCSDHTSCFNCTFGSNCIWCNNLNQCVDRNAYVVSFPYGQCMSWSQHPNFCHSKEVKSTNYTSQCNDITSCDSCLSSPFCGWCDLGSGTGLGMCMDGSDSGPLIVNRTGSFVNNKACEAANWNFTNCPACQCNGHSKCDEKNKCVKCEDFTTGEHCEICIPGFYGDATNGGRCKPCECNGQAKQCDHEKGRCFCTTKGIAGDQCERCDTQNKYTGDPTKAGGSCFYDLQIDYQFTFNLSKREDRNYTQINFRNVPSKSEIDTDFQITCSILAKMNISVKIGDMPEKFLLAGHNCTTFKTRFQKTEYNFGSTDNTTFYVYVYDFHPPLWIQISFSQSPKLDLLHFFITFSTCFLLLLFVAAVLWKIKQKYDMYRRRQRLFVEMEQMASRPFAQVYIEVGKPFSQANFSSLRKRRKEWPGPIALEPCHGNRGAVLSCLVSLPTGGQNYAPQGQTAICVASALVALGNPRKVSFDPISKAEGKNSKLRKSIPSHSLNTCI